MNITMTLTIFDSHLYCHIHCVLVGLSNDFPQCVSLIKSQSQSNVHRTPGAIFLTTLLHLWPHSKLQNLSNPLTMGWRRAGTRALISTPELRSSQQTRRRSHTSRRTPARPAEVHPLLGLGGNCSTNHKDCRRMWRRWQSVTFFFLLLRLRCHGCRCPSTDVKEAVGFNWPCGSSDTCKAQQAWNFT